MSESKYCFMHTQEVECSPRCMAYRFRPAYEEPTCVILEVGDAIIGTLIGMALTQQKQQENAVKHGRSAPPPEVT